MKFRKMQMRFLFTLLLLASFALESAQSQHAATPQRTHLFPGYPIYDNLFYKGKPNTTLDGLVRSNIVYEGYIWPRGTQYGVLPDRNAFEAIVRAHMSNPGPVVLDIEKLPLSGSKKTARQHLAILMTLADWAHEAAPGKVIGFYGTNTLSHLDHSDLGYARELAQHVDAFFPSMYTFNDDRAGWVQRAQQLAAEDRALAPGKPVYFYLWPQYHDGTPKQFEYIDASYWRFQLEVSYQISDGLVLWSSGVPWNDATGWWRATQQFAQAVRAQSGRKTP